MCVNTYHDFVYFRAVCSLQPAPAFRLFLTMEINPKLPVNLLRAGRAFVFEPPPGIRANLLRTFSQIPAARMTKVNSPYPNPTFIR